MLKTILMDVLNSGLFGEIKRQTAYLKENAPDAELKLVKISNVPKNSVLLGLDKVKSNTLFQKGRGQNMRCDYLLISDGMAYFMELKTSSKSEERYKEDCIKKFKAVECLTDYIDSVMMTFYNKEKLFSILEKRYILIYKAPSINKTTTSQKPIEKPIHDKPETMLFCPVEKNECEVDLFILG
jgi:hypothetical protein